MNGFYPTEFENYEQGTKRRSMSNASSSPYAKFRFRSQVPSPTSTPESLTAPVRERYLGIDGERNPNWSPEQGLPRWLRQRMMETQGRYNEDQRQGRSDPNSQQAIQARQFFERQRQKRINPDTYMRGGFERKGSVRNPLLFGM
jgi:hypothetical protein